MSKLVFDNKLVRFLVIGSLAFVVDYSIFYIGVNYLNHNVYITRVYAFFIAVLITWFGNRYFTFNDRIHSKYSKQVPKAFIGATVSLLINFTFFSIVLSITKNQDNVYLAFILAVIAGTASNFILSSRYIYK